jgi:hypothetical protein
MKLRSNGHYYNATLETLLDCLEAAEKELAVWEADPGKPAAYNAARRRKVIAKLKASIAARVAWHRAELKKGLDAGFAPSEHFEPRTRSINYPKARRASAHV